MGRVCDSGTLGDPPNPYEAPGCQGQNGSGADVLDLRASESSSKERS